MTPWELARIVTRFGPLDRLETVKDALFLLRDDYAFIRHSHDCLLAVRDYMQGKPNANYHLHPARVRRARLAAEIRWYYHYQEPTFKRALAMLTHGAITPELSERLWQEFKAWEGRRFAEAHR